MFVVPNRSPNPSPRVRQVAAPGANLAIATAGSRSGGGVEIAFQQQKNRKEKRNHEPDDE